MLLHLWTIFLLAQFVSSTKEFLSNDTLAEIQKLNALGYSHESERTAAGAEFTFKIANTTYAVEELKIVEYYFSITFLEENSYEVRQQSQLFTNEELTYQGKLNMKGLDKKGVYLVCVFFINATSYLIGSSRFCHVVCASEHCELEDSAGAFDNQLIYALLPCVAFVLVLAVLFSCIRDYVNRPRTADDLLETLPEHHAEDLRTIAGHADNRRRRRTQADFTDGLRGDSVISVNYDPNTDHEYKTYHGIDNVSLDTVLE